MERIVRVTTPTGDPAWLVPGYDDVKEFLGDPRLGRSHPDPERAARLSRSALFGGPMGDPATEAAEHARMRRLLTPEFSAYRMAGLRPRVRELVADLLDRLLATAPPVDFHEAVSFPLPALVICELLGVPPADRDEFRRWSDDAAHKTDEARSQAGLRRLWEYMRALVVRKRAEPGDDVLSRLAVADGGGDVDGVAMLAAGLLFAGHETTVAAIDRAVTLLCTNPDQHAALVEDRSRIGAAVEEVLRAAVPLPAAAGEQAGGLPRYPATDIEVHGVTVRAGELVLLGLHTANRDAIRFADPDRFDVGREPNPHLTFGHGPRFCLGAPLARLELRELLSALLERCPTLHLAVPVEALRPRDELLTGGLVDLPVTWSRE